MIAIDLPGFGDSDQAVGAAYDPLFFARAVGTGSTRSRSSARTSSATAWAAGWRSRPASVADRIGRLALMTPSLAWLRERRWGRSAGAPALELGSCTAPRR